MAKSCSSLERRADDAEREVDKMKKTEFMQSKIGECYEGVISGVTSWGIYVELPNTIEGMIRLADLTDDVYEYDAANYRVVGTYSAKEYRLGQKMRVQVVRADKNLRTIDFLPENMEKREEDE
ncbi:MAG: S1 RNA-binding domain-containing protein [Eubacterium sp.]